MRGDRHGGHRRGAAQGRRALRWVAALIAVGATYHLVVRPRHLQWGATDEEARRPLPGDDLTRPTPFRDTRALTIDAPPEAVWPWLAQIGWGRGGFYSYNWLENLFGGDLHNADRIHEQWQSIAPGDEIWMAPPGRWGEPSRAVVAEVEPGHHLLLGARDLDKGPWVFVLEPLDDGRRTRLIVRWQQSVRTPFARAYMYLVFEPAHFLMETGMMKGLRARAETTAEDGGPRCAPDEGSPV